MGRTKTTKRSIEAQAWEWIDSCQGNEISDSQLKSAYRLTLTNCEDCKRNCVGNPNCLLGIGESKWEFSPDELESTNSELFEKFEKELSKEKRFDGSPCGLINLGATCYVNTYIQLWFHNTTFRNAVYSLISPDNPILTELQLVFGLLEKGKSHCVNPTNFVKSLGLATDLQQDAQEFSKLFLSLLGTTPALSSAINDQFSGEYAYVTKCKNCGLSNERLSEYYELDLNIQGHKTIQGCISDFLKIENLNGDNQYDCDKCQGKQDATRQIVLKSLPNTLSLQLLRFIYDRASQRRQKIATNLSFPSQLNFSPYIANSSSKTDWVYNLSAVLLHQGPSASSGHFITNILVNPKSNEWYRFNDENVTRMKSAKNLDGENDDSNIWQCGSEVPAKKIKLPKGLHSSKDVYMLVYTKAASAQNNDTTPQSIPPYIESLIEKENNEFDESQSIKLKEISQEHENDLSNTRKMQNFIELLHSDEDEKCFIPTFVLKSYLNQTLADDKIDTLKLMSYSCCHGNLDFNKVHSLKYIPAAAAQEIFNDYENCKHFSKMELCRACVNTQCQLLRSRRKLEKDYLEYNKLLRLFAKNEESDDKPCFYVDKDSLRRWKTLALRSIESSIRNADKTLPSDNDEVSQINSDNVFNNGILCEHSKLTTNQKGCQLVPPAVWSILRTYFPDAPEMTSEEEICAVCVLDEHELEQESIRLKSEAQDLKNDLPHLFTSRYRPDKYLYCDAPNLIHPLSNEHVPPGLMKFYFVSDEFLDDLRDFIKHPTKYGGKECLEICNAEFLCSHNKLIHDPVHHLLMDGPYEDILPGASVVWEYEWEVLKGLFTFDHEIYIMKCMYHPRPPKRHKPCDIPYVNIESMPVLECQACLCPLQVSPCLCTHCMEIEAEAKRKSLSSFDNATIYICMSESANGSCSGSTFLPGNGNGALDNHNEIYTVRRSNRTKHGALEKKITHVSSEWSLKTLKKKIMEYYAIPPFDQNLYFQDKHLTDDDQTLKALSMFPGCTLTLVEDRPVPDQTTVLLTPVNQDIENGFKGTGLIGF